MTRIPPKPQFEGARTLDLKRSLENLKSAVESHTGVDGKVNLDAVEAQVAGDTVAKEALDAIRSEDGFQRSEHLQVGAAGVGALAASQRQPPAELRGGEVMTVLNALISARTHVDAQDSNRDGKINADEVPTAEGVGLDGKIANRAMQADAKSFNATLDAWRDGLREIKSEIRNRNNNDASILESCQRVCETPLGAEAMTWFLRDLITKQPTTNRQIEQVLIDADLDRGFFSRFTSHNTAKGDSVSDEEVMRYVGAIDLRAFIEGKQSEVNARVGGDYLGGWLNGADIDGRENVSDADLQGAPARAMC